MADSEIASENIRSQDREDLFPPAVLDLPVTVYSPESALRQPGKMLRDMSRDLWSSRDLAWRIFLRDTRAQHRQSLLGYFWILLPPLVQTAIWVFLNGSGILKIADTGIPYPVFVLIGTMLWSSFTDALRSPLDISNQSKPILARVNFPREAIILAGMGQVALNTAMRLLFVAMAIALFRITLPYTAFLFPIGVLTLWILGLSIGLLLTPLGLLYSDVGRGIGMVTTLWFYLTPVVYPPPTEFPASLLAKLNPVRPLLVTTRDWLTTGSTDQLVGFVVVSLGSLVLLFIAWILYRVSMPHLIVRMQT